MTAAVLRAGGEGMGAVRWRTVFWTCARGCGWMCGPPLLIIAAFLAFTLLTGCSHNSAEFGATPEGYPTGRLERDNMGQDFGATMNPQTGELTITSKPSEALAAQGQALILEAIKLGAALANPALGPRMLREAPTRVPEERPGPRMVPRFPDPPMIQPDPTAYVPRPTLIERYRGPWFVDDRRELPDPFRWPDAWQGV